jgi:hypothetical protein
MQGSLNVPYVDVDERPHLPPLAPPQSSAPPTDMPAAAAAAAHTSMGPPKQPPPPHCSGYCPAGARTLSMPCRWVATAGPGPPQIGRRTRRECCHLALLQRTSGHCPDVRHCWQGHAPAAGHSRKSRGQKQQFFSRIHIDHAFFIVLHSHLHCMNTTHTHQTISPGHLLQ